MVDTTLRLLSRIAQLLSSSLGPTFSLADLELNNPRLLTVLVVMTAITIDDAGQLPADADAAIRQLYRHHAEALRVYIGRFCTDHANADDIVQETFIRAWRYLPKLSADERPIRPWLFRVARNLLIDADRAARARPIVVQRRSRKRIPRGSSLGRCGSTVDRPGVGAAGVGFWLQASVHDPRCSNRHPRRRACGRHPGLHRQRHPTTNDHEPMCEVVG
jgi:RNA polymerase sigma factor (sigma-70 family)